MPFEYIFIAFATRQSPPIGSTMKTARNNYFFASLCHDDLIYTADYEVWSGNTNENGKKLEQYSFCPSGEAIISALKQSENNCHVILALTELSRIDPPGSQDVYLELETIQSFANQINAARLIEIGFDVVDQWTGLSVLTNVGYSKGEVVDLPKLDIKTNQFGLLASIDDAIKFVAFASNAVPEHLPLIAVKILKNS